MITVVRRLAPELLVFGLGALAFAVDALRPGPALPPVAADARRIEVPAGEVLQRTPLAMADDDTGSRGGEVEAARWIRAEVLYREALRLGLDEGDVIVRRRLVQKMEYLLDGMAAIPELSPEALETYYHAHADRYRRATSYGFRHIYFSAARGIDVAMEHSRRALTQLRDGDTQPDRLGDPYPDGSRYAQLPAARVLQIFGEEFLQELDRAPENVWFGPLRSRHGIHLVLREHTQPPQLPPLDEVRSAVARDLIDESRRTQREQRYAQIEARYDVVRR
jgi:hypothetical protein